jgi:hypothetical protein
MLFLARAGCARFVGRGRASANGGGARVIYFTRLTSGELVLLLVYAKAKFDNLRPEFLLRLREKFDEQANQAGN